MVATHNYTWQQGEDLILSMLYKEGPVGAEVPINLTGYDLRMDIVGPDGLRRYTFNSSEVADVDPETPTLEPDSTTEATLGTEGQVTIAIPRALTLPTGELWADITATTPILTFQYDVFLRNVSGTPGTIPVGKQKKILKGTITVEKSVTLWA